MHTPAEYTLLGLSLVLGLVQLMWAAGAARSSGQDLKWAAGPRDEVKPVGVVAARLQRAFSNYMETFPFFAAAILACGALDKFGDLTLWGATLYVAARALYVPIYAAGIPRLRSAVWAVAMIGLVLLIAAIFL